MYRMIKAVSNDGVDKLNDIAAIHSLEGSFYWMPLGRIAYELLYK